MAYATHSGDCDLCGEVTARVASSGRTPTVADGVGAKLKRLARRVTGALDARRQKEVDREIGRLLARSGGRITDSMEREIMQKVFASDWSLPQ